MFHRIAQPAISRLLLFFSPDNNDFRRRHRAREKEREREKLLKTRLERLQLLHTIGNIRQKEEAMCVFAMEGKRHFPPPSLLPLPHSKLIHFSHPKL